VPMLPLGVYGTPEYQVIISTFCFRMKLHNKEISQLLYEKVLVAPVASLNWVEAHGSSIPPNAVPGGKIFRNHLGSKLLKPI
jgi:hypothetical protein